jgi:hypothetical protein
MGLTAIANYSRSEGKFIPFFALSTTPWLFLGEWVYCSMRF